MKKIFGLFVALASLTGCSQYSLVNSDVYNNADMANYHTFRIVTPKEGVLPPGMTMVTYYNISAAIREQLVERGYVEDPNSPILVNIGLTVNKEVAYQAFTTPGVWVTPPPGWVGAPLPPPQNSDSEAAAYTEASQLPGGGGPGLVAPPQGSGLHFNDYAPVMQHDQAPAPQPQTQPAPPQRPPIGPVHNGMVPFFMYPRPYYIPGNTQIVPSVYREGVLTMDIVDMQTHTPLYSSSVATILDNGNTQFRNLSGIAQAVKVLFSKFPVPLLPQYR